MLLFYLVAYLFSNMGAFMVVEAVAEAEGSSALRTFRGLAQRSPALALAMLLFLLSLGGIPFVVGFWAKLYILWAAAQAGLYGLVLLAAVLTVVALFYYLLVAKQMYIDAPARPTPVPVPTALALVLVVSAAAVVLLGLYPGPLRRLGDARGRAAVLTAGPPGRSLLPAALHVDPALGRLLVAPGDPRALRLDPASRAPTPSGRPARPSGPRSTRTGGRATGAASRPGPAAAGSGAWAKPGATPTRGRDRAPARSAGHVHESPSRHPLVPVACSDGPCPAAFSGPPQLSRGGPPPSSTVDVPAASMRGRRPVRLA